MGDSGADGRLGLGGRHLPRALGLGAARGRRLQPAPAGRGPAARPGAQGARGVPAVRHYAAGGAHGGVRGL